MIFGPALRVCPEENCYPSAQVADAPSGILLENRSFYQQDVIVTSPVVLARQRDWPYLNMAGRWQRRIFVSI
jgi:hypothetical protein